MLYNDLSVAKRPQDLAILDLEAGLIGSAFNTLLQTILPQWEAFTGLYQVLDFLKISLVTSMNSTALKRNRGVCTFLLLYYLCLLFNQMTFPH